MIVANSAIFSFVKLLGHASIITLCEFAFDRRCDTRREESKALYATRAKALLYPAHVHIGGIE